MKDRLPEPGKENRVRIRQDDGPIVEGVLEYADNAAQAGSAYCKANVLPDDVCDYLGLNRRTAEPKDAFAKLEIAGIQFDNFSTGNILRKISNPSGLKESKAYMAAASVGNYALFAGGEYNSTLRSSVDYYDDLLTHGALTTLSVARKYLGGASVGNYALFAGGCDNSLENKYATVDAFNASLTRSAPTSLSGARYELPYLPATSVGEYALFGSGNPFYDKVDAYNTSLTRTIPTVLSQARYSMGAAANENYALFAGGYLRGGSSGYTGIVDYYTTGLTRGVANALSPARGRPCGATIGEYILFAGGSSSVGTYDVVEAYDRNLTKSTLTALSQSMATGGGVTVGGYALFAGDVVNSYDASLTRRTATSLGVNRGAFGSAATGRYALFAGGINGNSTYTTVEAYETLSAEITIPPFSKYNFTGVTNGEEQTIRGKNIISGIPLTGYIKKITELSGTVAAN